MKKLLISIGISLGLFGIYIYLPGVIEKIIYLAFMITIVVPVIFNYFINTLLVKTKQAQKFDRSKWEEYKWK